MDKNSYGHRMTYSFSQANPIGSGLESDVPARLRRVADTIEKLDGATVWDLALHHEVIDDGN